MPAPMMMPKPPAQPGNPGLSFNSNAPGGGAQVAGFNYGLQNLNKALGASQNTTQAGQMQLQQQLQQNQANVQQNLTNRGLGNTTISQTMAQAPLQTFNLGSAQLNDLSAQRQMQAYGNLAQMAGQGGSAISQTAQPYAQTNFLQNLMRQQQQQAPAQVPNAALNLPTQDPTFQRQLAMFGPQATQNLYNGVTAPNFAPGTVHGMY